ncbi:hypothetical protein PFISCL1PPCAC_26746, partial [Pristionchus fissidentatus]
VPEPSRIIVNSPIERKAAKQPSRQNSFKEPLSDACIASITITGSPHPPIVSPSKSEETTSSEEDFVIIRSEEEEISISMKDSSSSPSIDGDRPSSNSSERSEGQKREVVLDPKNPDSDYCYTLPNKTL